jgi:tRNA/tmRNA/rRNA uracil-C5-methylase (TrmA/RlmC/RlmD family)
MLIHMLKLQMEDMTQSPMRLTTQVEYTQPRLYQKPQVEELQHIPYNHQPTLKRTVLLKL